MQRFSSNEHDLWSEYFALGSEPLLPDLLYTPLKLYVRVNNTSKALSVDDLLY